MLQWVSSLVVKWNKWKVVPNIHLTTPIDFQLKNAGIVTGVHCNHRWIMENMPESGKAIARVPQKYESRTISTTIYQFVGDEGRYR